ncbi:MAG: pilus assembly PilX family protein [Saccharospirillum sp.]
MNEPIPSRPEMIRRRFPAQAGSALLVSLVMLLLISIIAVGAMQSSILQERMSSNLQNRELALQAAETALREAERFLATNNNDTISTQDFTYQIAGVNVNGQSPPDWEDDASDTAGPVGSLANNINGVAAQPNFYIEEISQVQQGGVSTELGVEDPGTIVYRITARSFGGTADTVVILRSVYRRL